MQDIPHLDEKAVEARLNQLVDARDARAMWQWMREWNLIPDTIRKKHRRPDPYAFVRRGVVLGLGLASREDMIAQASAKIEEELARTGIADE